MGLPVGIAYFVLIGIVSYAALKHRREGWWAALVLAIILLMLPLFPIILYFVFDL